MNIDKPLVLEKYTKSAIPLSDWQIIDVFDDILMCRFADTPEGDTDGEHVIREGIIVPLDTAVQTWRVVEVLKRGPKVDQNIQEGDLLMIPNDRGLSCVQQHNGKREKILFINEERVFCKVEKRDIEG